MKKRKSISLKSETDWKRIDAMKDSDIDYSDCPPATPEMFARGIVRVNMKPVPRKVQLTVRVDQDVLAWFRSRGRGYQTQINALLRAFMEATNVSEQLAKVVEAGKNRQSTKRPAPARKAA